MGNFLEDLSVFDNEPDEARKRALIQFGLGLMQPQNPNTGGALPTISNSIQSGLGSLDQDRATRVLADQQAFQNLITERGATDTESRTGILGREADTKLVDVEGANVSRVDASLLGKAELKQGADEFKVEGVDRKAERELKASQQRLNDRLPVQPKGGAAAALELQRYIDKKAALLAEDQLKNPRDQLYEGEDDVFLIDAAWSAVAVESASKSLQNMPIVVGAGMQKDMSVTERGADIGNSLDSIINPTLANLKSKYAAARKPGDDARADVMMNFTPEDWQKFMAMKPPPENTPAGKEYFEMLRIYDMYPGIPRKARAALELLGSERND